ncbi:MAG TPA: DUF488 domain-containing protein [Ktedonobacteraceae bacterium]|nr:DUF488 domain-containing protein [Ktedonobacteraceae bacterium]
MKPKIVTIGVYGFEKDTFFQALLDAEIDVFCDIRRRRGMRGSSYAFANSASLQKQLSELGIRYLHVKDLAPTQTIRDRQQQEDKKLNIAKRARTALGETFIQAYEQECLSAFDSTKFLQGLGQETRVIGLFCVERDPEACHRSLAARRLAEDLGLQVEHIKP